jgi:hypothetical protein
MKKTILIAVVFTVLVIACKKSDNSSPSVIAKWNIVKSVTWTTPSGGTTKKDTISAFGQTSTLDLRSDGKIYIQVPGLSTNDTLSYTLNGNMLYTNRIATGDKDTLTMLNVTNNNLTLYNKKNDLGDLTEDWIFLSK